MCFLRGIIIAASSINDPHKGYHFEVTLALENQNKLSALNSVFDDFGFEPKKSIRNGKCSLYFKSNTTIADILSYAGAMRASFEVANTYIERDIRNNENRATNFVAKNISKTEIQKRQYLRTNFLKYNEITSDQFDIFYSFITVKYFAIPNQFVFLQNADINTITIIYNGQFALTSNGKRIIKLNNKVILGLESIFTDDYSTNKTFPKYKYSLLSEYSGEVGMIMQIKREFIPDFLIDSIKQKFQYYYETFTSTIDALLTQKIKVEKARNGTNINKSVFYSMNENQKCETAIDIYFKLAENNDLVPENKVMTPLKGASVSHKKQILKDFTIRKRFHKKNQDLCNQSHNAGNISNGLVDGNILYRNIKNNSIKREKQSYFINNKKDFSFSRATQLRKDSYNQQHFRLSINKSTNKDYSLNNNSNEQIRSHNHSFYLNRSNSSGIMSVSYNKMKQKLQNHFALIPIKKIIYDYKSSPRVSYNSGNFNLPFVSQIMKGELKGNLNCSC
jgi:hypothetical protein